MASLARTSAKTLFVATSPVVRSAAAVPAVARPAAGASHGHGHGPSVASPSVRATVSPSGTVSAKTSFVASVFQQKRFYAAPVTVAHPDSDVNVPPESQQPYKKAAATYNDQSSRNFAYFMIGNLSAFGAVAAKNVVTDYLVNLSASADVLALAKVELDMAAVPEGKNVVLKWRGKPVFVRHRTAEEIAEANTVDLAELRHKETDSDRTKQPEWLVMLGVCTHLGCVPIGEAGEYGGWFCPCHGSHYDISGRIRKGPAPLNLEIPEYVINEDEGKIIIG